MTAYLRQLGYQVGEKRVRRLLRQMGLDAIYQHPNTSKPNSKHQVYPYLLRHVPISRCNQVWSTDITYIRLAKGFVYLMAVIDWYSRYVLDWSLSTTLEADFCVDTVSSLLHNGLRCEIFNTDQGSQFTSQDLPDRSLSRVLLSVWMVAVGHWIISLWKGFGGQSGKSRFERVFRVLQS